jgi:hypothetical protein
MDSVRRGWPGGAGQTAGNRDLGDHTNLGDELPPLRNRHNGCVTTGNVARTDPFPQIAAGAGQPRGPAGRSTESRRPFHPFGAAITRCFTAIPAPLTPTHNRQVFSTVRCAGSATSTVADPSGVADRRGGAVRCTGSAACPAMSGRGATVTCAR